MFGVTRWIPSALALAVLLAIAGVAVAWPLVYEVKDDGKVLGEEVIKKANAEIKTIKEQFKKDLVIETYKELPADDKEAYEKVAKDRKETAKFFAKWAQRRAEKMEVNGVYVVVFRNPTHLEIEVGTETGKKAFTLDDRTKVGELLSAKIKEKEFDKAWLEATAFVHDTIKTNTKQAAVERHTAPVLAQSQPVHQEPRPSQGRQAMFGSLGSVLCMGLVVVLVIWVVIGLIR